MVSGNDGKKLLFTLLREETDGRDLFEDKTHDKIAEMLYSLIVNERGGVTIGLEGAWGSGKSAVISILKNKINESPNKDISLFVFDAWAHEGDPLRRIFLESIIEGLFNKNEKSEALKKLQDEITKRKKHTTVKTTRTATMLGKLIGFSTLFIPIGLGLFQKVKIEDLTYSWGGKPHYLFLTSMFFVFAPFIVLLCNLIRLMFNKKSRLYYDENNKQTYSRIFDSRNWPIIQSNTTDDVTQQVSEDEERSSIEFENYFNQIAKLLFEKKPAHRLVMVFDNLDRIETADSLKIWSTLQTFLQQRNNLNNKKTWFDKIWVIVPYDPEGLRSLWDKNESTFKSKSFFDKCFQLKFDVPKSILTGWEKFAKEKIDYAFNDWDDNEKEIVLNILKLTRKDLADTPTPREIKNYINQIGLLKTYNHIMPTESIAYYVSQRTFNFYSVDTIRKRLFDDQLIEQNHLSLLSPSIKKDISGIVFGVSSEKGQQLLLEPDIKKALNEGNSDRLKDLQKKHQEGFWCVFNYHLRATSISFEELLHYAKSIHEGIWGENKSELLMFKHIAISVEQATNNIVWPSKGKLEFYKHLSDILDNQNTCDSIYKKLTDEFEKTISAKDAPDMSPDLFILQELVQILKITKVFELDLLTYHKLLPLAIASFKTNIPAWKWILPKQPLAHEISNNIKPNIAIINGIKETIIYLNNAKASEDWAVLVDSCNKYISKYNNGPGFSVEVFEILFELAFNNENYNKEINNIVRMPQFYNLAWDFRQKIMPQLSLLCGKYVGKELNTLSPQLGNSVIFNNELKKYWNTHNQDNAKKTFDLIKKYNKWSFLWELAIDLKNKLVADIILLALKENEIALFEIDSGLQRIKIASDLLDNNSEQVNLLVQSLIKNSSIENDIIEDANLSVAEFAKELCLIVEYSNNEEFISGLTKKVKYTPETIWKNAFKEDNYLIALAIEIKEKNHDFGLDNDYAMALLDFVMENMESSSNLTKWQKESWHSFVGLMNDAFQEQYKTELTDLFMRKYTTISDDFIFLNREYFNSPTISGDIVVVQQFFKNALESENFIRLEWINNSILSSDNLKKFKTKEHFPEVIKKPLIDLLNKQEKTENIKLIKELAFKFNVQKLENEIKDKSSDIDDDLNSASVSK
jgi:hypothetical protein